MQIKTVQYMHHSTVKDKSISVSGGTQIYVFYLFIHIIIFFKMGELRFLFTFYSAGFFLSPHSYTLGRAVVVKHVAYYNKLLEFEMVK